MAKFRIIKKVGSEDGSTQYIIQERILFFFWVTATHYVFSRGYFNRGLRISPENCIFATEHFAHKILNVLHSGNVVNYKDVCFINAINQLNLDLGMIWVRSDNLNENSTDLESLKKKVDIEKQNYKEEIIYEKK